MKPPQRRLLLEKWLGKVRNAMAVAVKANVDPGDFGHHIAAMARGQAASDAAMQELLVRIPLLRVCHHTPLCHCDLGLQTRPSVALICFVVSSSCCCPSNCHPRPGSQAQLVSCASSPALDRAAVHLNWHRWKTR